MSATGNVRCNSLRRHGVAVNCIKARVGAAGVDAGARQSSPGGVAGSQEANHGPSGPIGRLELRIASLQSQLKTRLVTKTTSVGSYYTAKQSGCRFDLLPA